MADRAYKQAVSGGLSMHVDRDGATVFARLAGELDLAAEEPLDKILDDLAGEADTRSLVVDLRGVTFLDSIGLRILLKQEMSARRDAFDFALIPPHGPAMRVLELSGVNKLIELRTPSGHMLGGGARAGERASAGLGTREDDPAGWLAHPEPEEDPPKDGPMEIF
jgi:anti-anti-sigma factor